MGLLEGPRGLRGDVCRGGLLGGGVARLGGGHFL